MRARGGIGAAIGLAIVVVAVWLARPAAPDAGLDASSASQGRHDAELATGTPAVPEVGAPTSAPPAAPPAGASVTAREREMTELRQAIERARAVRLGLADPPVPATEHRAEAAPGSADEGEPVGSLDREYIRGAIRELHPLLAECYELAREAAERDGASAPEGRLVMRFVIGGEPEVGGVIEESAVMDESEVRHPVLEECFRETIYTVELPAPEQGGRVTVHYPFMLSASDEEEP